MTSDCSSICCGARIESALPDTVAGIVDPFMAKWLRLVPSWCHILRLRYDSELKDTATIIGKPEYRDAVLTFGPQIADALGDDDVERVVVHELLHLHQEQSRDVFLEALEFIPEGPFRETFRTRYHYANEGAVCDLTRCFTGWL